MLSLNLLNISVAEASWSTLFSEIKKVLVGVMLY